MFLLRFLFSIHANGAGQEKMWPFGAQIPMSLGLKADRLTQQNPDSLLLQDAQTISSHIFRTLIVNMFQFQFVFGTVPIGFKSVPHFRVQTCRKSLTLPSWDINSLKLKHLGGMAWHSERRKKSHVKNIPTYPYIDAICRVFQDVWYIFIAYAGPSESVGHLQRHVSQAAGAEPGFGGRPSKWRGTN